ncbi:hypothetical protein, partial [Comamonas sp.]|uniref:hypothetical protein n=1 Tax=Comamonas sp. TaxID=34028 RepID=UPI0028B1BD50
MFMFMFMFMLLHVPAARLGFAGRISPGGRGTFLGDQEKYPKEGRPAACDPSRCEGQPVSWHLWGVPRNSLRAKALRSNRRGKLVHEALALFGASATPQTPRPRRMQKG